jgi:hypothetical protein
MRLNDDYVVVEPLAVEHTDRVDRWLARMPGVRVVFANPAGTVYEMPEPLDSRGCEIPGSNGGSE